MNNQPKDELNKLLEEIGIQQSIQILQQARNNQQQQQENILTIISNAGTHHIPNEYLKGEVFEASIGNLDFSTKESINFEIKKIIIRTANKLKSKKWEKIYLIPTGHAIISLQIKLVVYQITRLPTIDLFYHKGNYTEIDIEYRQIMNGSIADLMLSL